MKELPHPENNISPQPELPLAERSEIDVRRIVKSAVAILAVLVVTVVIIIFAPQVQQFHRYGYHGVFLISLIGNATIVLPVPSLAVTFAMGSTLNWVIVGLVAGIGEALGETTGYLAGYGGSAVIENKQLYTRMQYWMENYGTLTIFTLSVIPNPLIDLAGIAAGALRFSFYRFLLTVWLGKTIKTLFFAWAGANSIGWLSLFLG